MFWISWITGQTRVILVFPQREHYELFSDHSLYHYHYQYLTETAEETDISVEILISTSKYLEKLNC